MNFGDITVEGGSTLTNSNKAIRSMPAKPKARKKATLQPKRKRFRA